MDVPLLSDFGFARIRHDISRSMTISHSGGTIRHMAPEILCGDEVRPTPPSDVWSFAMTIIELSTGAHPFKVQLLVVHAGTPLTYSIT